MKSTNTWENRSHRRDDDRYDNGNDNRHPVGEELFGYNRRFSSDYANFDSAHAADYQRHTDFADEYNNLREGYYRQRGTQTGNSMPSQYPDAYGNRYGKDGEFSSDTRYNDQRNRLQAGGQAYQKPSFGDTGYRQSSGNSAYGDDRYAQGGANRYGANPDQYGTGSAYSNMGGSMNERSNHRGKGPKSYVRSDDRIREDISDRLRDDEHIDATDIDVEVSGSEVVLTGTVDSRFAKRHAEDLAESISGVRNVENRIRVRS